MKVQFNDVTQIVLAEAILRARVALAAVQVYFGVRHFDMDAAGDITLHDVDDRDRPRVERLLVLLFDPKVDPYTAVAAIICGVEPADVVPEARDEVKRMLFAHAYGGTR